MKLDDEQAYKSVSKDSNHPPHRSPSPSSLHSIVMAVQSSHHSLMLQNVKTERQGQMKNDFIFFLFVNQMAT